MGNQADSAATRSQSKSASHTPGPWEVAEHDKHGQRIVRSEHIEICTCWHHCVGSIELEMEANARLIAAVPDLLALARQYASECARCGGSAEIVLNDRGDDPEWDYCQPCNECQDIWAVIDKAEGRK